MKKVLATIAVLGLMAGAANAQLTKGSLGFTLGCDGAEANQVCIVNATGDAQTLLGVNLLSTGGHLGGDGKPFGFALANTPNNITLANILPPPVVVPAGGSLPINVTYGGDFPKGKGGAVDLPSDLTGSTIGDSTGADVAAVAFPVIPEPTSGVLAAFALLGALGFRRRR